MGDALQEAARTHAGDHWPAAIYEIFMAQKIKLVSYVPDAGHRELIELCQTSDGITDVSLTTEEEGVALAAGAYTGGKKSVLLMQSSGVGNCVNMFSLIKTCNFPFLTLVTMRGEWGEFNPWQVPMGQAAESVMRSMGLLVYRIDDAADVAETVNAAIKIAFNGQQAVAVLFGQRLLGAKDFNKE